MSRIDHEDYSHPEKLYPGLVLIDESVTDSKYAAEIAPARVNIKSMFSKSEEGERKKELCWNCGWTVEDQLFAGYGSRIRIFHIRLNVAIWQIGSRWMIRDQPNDKSLGNDYMTQNFLRQQPGHSIPILKEMRLLSEPTDKVCLTLMSRAQGVGLDTIWEGLSVEQKTSYRNQMKDILKQMRSFTSPVCAKVNGDLMDDGTVAQCFRRTAPTCFKMGRTKDEWLENLSSELHYGLSRRHETEDPVFIEEKFQELKRNFPQSEPYVLTHADLNLTNIIVKDDKIEAIIDWEYAGFMPWWVERWMAGLDNSLLGRELFLPIWEELDGGDYWNFAKEVRKPVQSVISAFQLATDSQGVSHPIKKCRWLRPAFCDCKPYGGWFEHALIGKEIEHVRLFDT